MACLNICGNRAWFARALSYWGHLETARFGARAEEKNSTLCVIASAPTNDHAQIRFCTLWVCKQQDYDMHSRYTCADPGIFGGGGGVQVNLTKKLLRFFCFFWSSAYFTEVKWLISKKTIIFQGSRVGPTFSRGVQLFPGGPIAYFL